MATIYLSSTYEDLKDFRRVVFEALRKGGYDVIAMEDYVATDQRPVEKCLKDVEKADIYVGLFAFRYGYVPPPQHQNPKGSSITELEFRHADALHKPCLTFVVNDSTAWARLFDDAYTSKDKGARIQTLRQYLLIEKLASSFSAPHELATLVLAAVTKQLENEKEHRSPTAQEPPALTSVTWDSEKDDSPYPGLMHFTPKYTPVFFGRDAEVREILDRMRLPEGRFILVSGNSGVGKSSVVDAGILSRIERTSLPGCTSCLCLRMVPSQGPHPFSALMGALHSTATRAGLNPKAIENELITSPQRLSYHVGAMLSKGSHHDALVLFLDQMEELFTAQDPEASKTFLSAVYEAAQGGALWVVATIRSDHLHHCHGHPDMLHLLRGKGHYPLGPIEPFMLSDLIAKPARCAGLRIRDTLVRRIVHETVAKADDRTGSDESNLPLLAFVLNQLFDKRQDHELSESVYEQLGGIKGAIAQHAAAVERALRQQHGTTTAILLPALLQSLIIVNAKGLPTRRRPLRSEFSSAMHDVIDTLVQQRLLHTEGTGEAATVSISHEALFEAWPSLQEYVAKNSKQLMDQTLLDSRSRKWEQMGKPWFSGLASGREYTDFQRAGGTATALTKEYLDASCRTRWLFNGAITLVIFLLLGTIWLWQKGYSVEQAVLKVQSLFVSIRVAPAMETVPAGTFRQGDIHRRGGPDEQPVHAVTIKPFAIGKFEVTFEEYDRYAIAMGRTLPGDQNWGRGRRPVINVSWKEAKDYADWLSRQTGNRYRLLTESEWEYAALSGAKHDIWPGTSDEKQVGDFAVSRDNSKNRTAPAGGKNPNSLGLYDMGGNVWEWVDDCWHDDYKGAPTNGTAWVEADGVDCGSRVIRGGSWGNELQDLRSSNRNRLNAVISIRDIGFRLALNMD